MSYTTPKTNWVSTDYFNIDPDWIRIYRNAQLASSLAAIELATPITFDILSTPPIATPLPSILSMVNTLLANIERVRLAMAALLPVLLEVKDDWLAGGNQVAPTFAHANQWEETVDAIWDYWNGDSLPVCPSLSADLTLSADYIVVDCIDTNGHTLDTNGHTLYII